MKWMKRSVILVLAILAGVLFALESGKVPQISWDAYAIDGKGQLSLLREDGKLWRVSSSGELLGETQLPQQDEEGLSIRYGDMVADDSGTLYLTREHCEVLVDGEGKRQEVISLEEVVSCGSDGTIQAAVVTVDKTALSGLSTQSYFRKLQMQGDTLLAICEDQGRYDILKVQPYGDASPETLSSFFLETEEDGEEEQALIPEDFAALSDGTLVYTTQEGGLYAIAPQEEEPRVLAESTLLAGQVSADEEDMVYYVSRSTGALYQLDPQSLTAQRLYSGEDTVNARLDITFDQLQQTQYVGAGDFCGVTIDGKDPVWLRFGKEAVAVEGIHQGWDLLRVGKTLLCALVAGALAAAIWWGISRLLGASRLVCRILLQFLPALVLVTALLLGGMLTLYRQQCRENLQDSLGAAARFAVQSLEGAAPETLPSRLNTLQRASLEENLEAAFQGAQIVSGLQKMGLRLYGLEDDSFYGLFSLGTEGFSSASYLAPLDKELTGSDLKQVEKLAEKDGGSVETTQGAQSYESYVIPLRGDDGEVWGLVEARAEKDSALPLWAGSNLPAVLVLAGAVLCCLLWLLAVLIGAFRPLKELSRCIAAIGGGNWRVKAKITSRDELAQIGISFNQMTEKLSQYISNMVLLNNEYIKFTPRELFQLLGKTKVTDLQLRDQQVQDMSLLYVTFGTPGEQMGNEDYFALMNENYDRIFDVVDINHGIIQRFDGAGMLALFPGQTRDALNTAISLKEIMAREERPVELKILISRDKTLVGVAGNQKRQTITAISKTIMDIYALNSLMDEIGTRYIITRRGVEGIGEDSYFSCREIGAGDWGRESLYEFLDGMDTYEKKLHLITREEFEKGIHDYQQKRYFEARKHFASVLQTNQRDQVAMYYLMLCDTHSQEGMARQN